MKVRTIAKRAQKRISLNKYYMWRVERVIYRACSATAKFNYEMSKVYAKARGEL